MSDLTEKFAALETQLSDQNAAILDALSTIGTNVGGIGEAITVLTNAVLNGNRQLIGALGNTGPCNPCPSASIVVPPIAVTTAPINSGRCQRVQAMLDMLDKVFASFDSLMSLDVIAAWTLISDVYGQTIATLGAADTIPLPSFPEAVNIAGDYFSFAAGRLFSSETAVGNLSSLKDAIQAAMFNTSTAEAAQAAYNGVVDSSSISNEGKLLLKATAYNGLFNYFLDPTTSPDLSGFDGSVCGIGLCMVFTAEETVSVTGEFGTGFIPNWEKYGITPVSLPGQDNAVWIFGRYSQWEWDTTGGTNVYKQAQSDPGGGNTNDTGAFLSLPFDDWYTFVSADGGFPLQFCPP